MAVQRAVAPGAPAGRAVPLLAATKSGPEKSPVRTAPPAQPLSMPNAYPAPAVVQRQAVAAPRTATATAPAPAAPAPPRPAPAPAPVPVQRAPERALLPTSARTTTAVSAVTARGSSSRDSSGAGSGDDPPPPYEQGGPPPAYTAVAKGQFDPRSLTDFQLDELTHRLIGRITRLIRTELRLDRERIGKLRDPRR
ncbi:extensin [Streptomyces tauricus]|uniref:extensin n=1 Tax=Streptomyces tauricus TaxID=68274 RepID=UPI00387F08E7